MTARELISRFNQVVLNPIIVLLFAVALVVFLYGVFQMIMNTGSEEKRREGGRHILWGLVGMLIMISVFGIMHIILNTFYLPPPPGLP